MGKRVLTSFDGEAHVHQFRYCFVSCSFIVLSLSRSLFIILLPLSMVCQWNLRNWPAKHAQNVIVGTLH